MIREAQRSELPAILELWLESTTWGHPFIKANYWRDCIPLVRDAYLANAQNGVGKKTVSFSVLSALWKADFWQRCLSHRRPSGAVLVRR